MQTASPFVANGLAELRNALSSPGDNLYGHLTDLILALDETGEAEGNGVEPILQTASRRNIAGLCSSSGLIDGQSPSACRANMMDTSIGPTRKKARRKIRRRRSVIIPACGLAESGCRGFGDGSTRGNHLSAVEVCISHSPVNYTSDSSVDKNTIPAKAQHMTGGVSDSDIERLMHVAASSTGTVVCPSPTNDNEQCQFRARNMGRSVCPDTALLSPALIQGLIESDSVTETVAPARHSYQRRKRLIKRMAIDQTLGDQTHCSDAQNQQIMDVDVSPRCVHAASASRKHPALLSENSGDYDEGSCPSSSESSDAGRQGDDELSDWYHYDGDKHPSDEYMGIPDLKQAVHLASAKTLNVESSDTDMSQSSSSISSKRLLSKNGALLCGALNRRILHFLRDHSETELSLGELRKRERKEALRLAMFYHLDVRREGAIGSRCYVLCKTKYSQCTD